MLSTAITIAALLFLPPLALWLRERFKFAQLLGPVFLCYAAGIALSFITDDTSFASTISELMIPLAIPLCLFSCDLPAVKKLARPFLTSFILVVISAVTISVAAFFIFRDRLSNCTALSAMTVGLYTGGTPNLLALGLAFGVPDSEIVICNTIDMIAGGLYFTMLISFMPALARRIFGKFKDTGGEVADDISIHKPSLKTIALLIPLAAICFAASVGVALLLTGKLDTVIIMLGVTLSGIVCSLFPKIKNMRGSFRIGQYFIYLFSVAVGISFDISAINASVAMLAAMFFFVQFGSVLLHMLLAKLFKIDGDTVIITSTAGIYGPAFIIPVANALGNRRIIASGLICGILGYAVANFIGAGIGTLLSLIP